MLKGNNNMKNNINNSTVSMPINNSVDNTQESAMSSKFSVVCGIVFHFLLLVATVCCFSDTVRTAVMGT